MNIFYKKEKRSQATVEFALLSGLFLICFLGLLEYGLYINTNLTVSSACREGGCVTARVIGNNIDRGLEAARNVCIASLGTNDFYSKGGVIVTEMTRVDTSATNLILNSVTVGPPATYSVGAYGNIFGNTNTLMSKSGILEGTDYKVLPRTGSNMPPILPTVVVPGKVIYCVEVFYTNGKSLFLDVVLPPVIYDKAFFLAP